MASSTQVSNAANSIRAFFSGNVQSTFTTTAGVGLSVKNRTLNATEFRSLDRITKKFGCTYTAAPSVTKGDAGFVITIENES